jgi:hypothetical protein
MILGDGGHWLAVKGALGCQEGRTLLRLKNSSVLITELSLS